MSTSAKNPSAAAESKTAGPEAFSALLTLAHGIMNVAEERYPTVADLERCHDMAQQVVKITAALLTDAMQGRLRL